MADAPNLSDQAESRRFFRRSLTTHASPDDFFDTLEAIKAEIDMTPFPSIWLYTGYYSDDDGSNCEFSIVPLKADDRIIGNLLAKNS